MIGIVINPEARIGSGVSIFQQVTIGDSGVDGKPGSPVVGDNVLLGAGCRVLGPIKVGEGAVIGANAVVTKDVPPHATIVGANRLVEVRCTSS